MLVTLKSKLSTLSCPDQDGRAQKLAKKVRLLLYSLQAAPTKISHLYTPATMEAIRKLVGRSASTILDDDVKGTLVMSRAHLDRLREFTRDAELEGRYAQLETRYETLKASPKPSTDEVKELLADLEKYHDEVSLRKNEAVRASLG